MVTDQTIIQTPDSLALRTELNIASEGQNTKINQHARQINVFHDCSIQPTQLSEETSLLQKKIDSELSYLGFIDLS